MKLQRTNHKLDKHRVFCCSSQSIPSLSPALFPCSGQAPSPHSEVMGPRGAGSLQVSPQCCTQWDGLLFWAVVLCLLLPRTWLSPLCCPGQCCPTPSCAHQPPQILHHPAQLLWSCFCLLLLHPKCRIWHLDRLNSIPFITAQCSRALSFCW